MRLATRTILKAGGPREPIGRGTPGRSHNLITVGGPTTAGRGDTPAPPTTKTSTGTLFLRFARRKENQAMTAFDLPCRRGGTRCRLRQILRCRSASILRYSNQALWFPSNQDALHGSWEARAATHSNVSKQPTGSPWQLCVLCCTDSSCVCVCVCVCEERGRKRERDREGEREMYVRVCEVCVPHSSSLRSDPPSPVDLHGVCVCVCEVRVCEVCV